MIIPKSLIAATALLALALVSYPTSAIAIETESARPIGLTGGWTGTLLQKEWTFDFKAQGAEWSGKYMPPGGVEWHPLTSVRVSKQSVTFGMDSKPKLSFELELDGTKPTMSGTVVIEGVATVPFMATRKP